MGIIKEKGHENLLTVTEAMNKYKITFKENRINLIEGYAGSGKTFWFANDFLNHTHKYIENDIVFNLCNRLSKVLYVCDTTMLMDSILSEYDDISKKLDKGGLKEAKLFNSLKRIIEDNDNGTIKVLSYEKLGILLKDDKCRKYIETNFYCIVMDEFHNLFKYYYDFGSIATLTVITKLNELASHMTLIAMTASPQPVDTYQYHNENCLNIHRVFNQSQISTLNRHFHLQSNYYHNGWNMIKDVKWEKIKGKYKVLIYTDFISTEKAYAEFLTKLGLNVCWLCSPNNGEKYEDIDLETGEVMEIFKPIMNEGQLSVRNYLIDTGELPEDLDVLIVNGAYQTGWSLKDENKDIQIVLVDSTKEDVHIQAIRVRHDIVTLSLKWTRVDDKGNLLYRNGNLKLIHFVEVNGRKYYYADEDGNLSGKEIQVKIPQIEIPNEFIGVKLSKEDKKFLVDRYAMFDIGFTSVSWQTLKLQLDNNNYKVISDKKFGTYIFNDIEGVDFDMVPELIEFANKHKGKRLTNKQKERFIILVNARNIKGKLLTSISKVNCKLSIMEIGLSVDTEEYKKATYWVIK